MFIALVIEYAKGRASFGRQQIVDVPEQICGIFDKTT